MNEPTFNTQGTTQKHVEADYRPIQYTEHEVEVVHVRQVLQYCLNRQTNSDWTLRTWRKHPACQLTYDDGRGRQIKSRPFTFDQLAEHIQQQRNFDQQYWNFRLFCPWLDGSTGIMHKHYIPQNEDPNAALKYSLPLHHISDNFPIVAAIDREGVALSSMQGVIQKSLLKLHHVLVTESASMFNLDSSWLHSLVQYFNFFVSIVDITLIQLYYFAKYEKSPEHWRFDTKLLGQPIGQRIESKLKWIGAITGNHLDNAQEERASFFRMKQIRNHLNHFDPPSFAYAIEDVAEWLNALPILGSFLFKIRQKLEAQITPQILSMMLAREVRWEPRDPGLPHRKPLGADAGYASSTWPSQRHLFHQRETTFFRRSSARFRMLIARVILFLCK